LAAEGWAVGAFDIDDAGLKTLSAEVGSGRLFPRTFDVRDYPGWQSAMAAFAERSGGQLHLLVNNAGVANIALLRDLSIERARQIVDVNFLGVVNGIHACLPLLEATPAARVVNVASIAALVGWPHAALYTATKGAVHNLTEALAAELGDRDITVCDVVPSFVDTALFGDEMVAEAVRRTLRRVLQSFADPDGVARAILATDGQRKVHHVVGKSAKAYAFTARVAPPLARLLARRLGRRLALELERLGKSAAEPRLKDPGPAD